MQEAPAEGGRAVPRSTRDRLLVLQQEPRNDWSVLPPALVSPAAAQPVLCQDAGRALCWHTQSDVWNSVSRLISKHLLVTICLLPSTLSTASGLGSLRVSRQRRGQKRLAQGSVPVLQAALGTALRLASPWWAAPVLWDLQ